MQIFRNPFWATVRLPPYKSEAVKILQSTYKKPLLKSRSDCLSNFLPASPTSPEIESKLQPPSAYHQFT